MTAPRWRRLAAALGVAAATGASANVVAAAAVVNPTVGEVAIQGTATATPGLGPPVTGPLTGECNVFPQYLQWDVSAQGVAGALEVAGNAYPPSGVTVSLTIVTCQSWWFGGPPVDVLDNATTSISGSIAGSAANGSTLSCSLSGSQFSYDAGVVDMAGAGQCTVDNAPVAVTFGFDGAFLPTSNGYANTTATVAGIFNLSG